MNKAKRVVNFEKSLEQLINNLFPLIEKEVTEAREKYDVLQRDNALPPKEAIRYFEYWRGLSRMEAIVKKFMKSYIAGLKHDR